MMCKMPESPTVLPGLRYARAFYFLLIAVVFVPVLTFLIPALSPVAEASTYVLPAGLALIAVVVYRLMMAGIAPIPVFAFITGAVFIAGGAGFDIFATLLHSPDLSRESNPIARLLLDSGKSVEFVMFFGAVCQSLAAIASVLLWGGLLSHPGLAHTNPLLRKELPSGSPCSIRRRGVS
jgi:hypothetical protein